MATKLDLPGGVHLCRRPDLPNDGCVVPVDKPQGWTSFDVVAKLRGLLGIQKIGHAGTLDPMATGLLLCLIGRATKAQDGLLGLPKAYEGTVRLGEVTPSQDAETEVTERLPVDGVTEEAIRSGVEALTGVIEQVPPMYSAVKVDGQRLYKLARKGQEIDRAARQAIIYRFDVEAVRLPDVDVFVACSKGTYVRTLAHDLGANLGVGGHLVRLRRTAIGDVRVDDAWTLEELASALGKPFEPRASAPSARP